MKNKEIEERVTPADGEKKQEKEERRAGMESDVRIREGGVTGIR